MSEYLKPPFKAFIKTETSKVVEVTKLYDSEFFKNDLYVVWDEIYYGTVATFRERVVATADTAEELMPPKRKPYERHKL